MRRQRLRFPKTAFAVAPVTEEELGGKGEEAGEAEKEEAEDEEEAEENLGGGRPPEGPECEGERIGDEPGIAAATPTRVCF